MTTQNLSDLKTTMIPWIGKTHLMIRLFIADKFKKKEVDLTVEQWILMKQLETLDGQIQNDLAYHTQRNKASLARLVSNMEKKNLVARIPSLEDKRANKVCLTKNGRKTLAMTQPIVEEAIVEMQNGIDQKDIELVINILNKVQKNIKNLPDNFRQAGLQ